MSAIRTDSIRSNIDFAFESNKELSQLIASAQKDDGKVKFIGHKAGNILGAVRECFDYCIADIKDDFGGNSSRSWYFPFHPDTMGKGKPLHTLTVNHQTVFNSLNSVASMISTKKMIPGTNCRYSDLRAVNNLVNAKKHDNVIVVNEAQNSKTRIEMPGGAVFTVSPIQKLNDDGTIDETYTLGPVGPAGWNGGPGVSIAAVKDFFFDAPDIDMSRRDVHGFCMTAITATRFVIGDVYCKVYGHDSDQFR